MWTYPFYCDSTVNFLYNLDPKHKPTPHLELNQSSGDLFQRWATFYKEPDSILDFAAHLVSVNYLTQSL